MKPKLYTCKYCKNTWTVEEGFDLKTRQCKSCTDWDKKKAISKTETSFPKVDFEYQAGDPFW